MKNASVVSTVLFGALILSGVLMLRNGFKAHPDERVVLTHWPQEVAQALDEYDLEKIADHFVDDFHDQEGSTKSTFKAYLALEKPQPTHWKAFVQSTQVEWNPQLPLEANLQVNFQLNKFGDPNSFEADLKLRKIDDVWKGVSVEIRKAVKVFDSKSKPPK